MKLILCCILVAVCIYLGIVVASNLKTKKTFWEDLVKFCEFLSANIGFGQKKINEVIMDYEALCSPVCKKVLMDYVAHNNPLLQVCLENFLNREEEQILKEFFNALGELDVTNELIKIENYRARFLKKYEQYLDKNNKYAPLTIKLSIIFGIVICIVFL